MEAMPSANPMPSPPTATQPRTPLQPAAVLRSENDSTVRVSQDAASSTRPPLPPLPQLPQSSSNENDRHLPLLLLLRTPDLRNLPAPDLRNWPASNRSPLPTTRTALAGARSESGLSRSQLFLTRIQTLSMTVPSMTAPGSSSDAARIPESAASLDFVQSLKQLVELLLSPGEKVVSSSILTEMSKLSTRRVNQTAQCAIALLKAISNIAAPNQSDAFMDVVVARLSSKASAKRVVAAVSKNKEDVARLKGDVRSLKKRVGATETLKQSMAEAVAGGGDGGSVRDVANKNVTKPLKDTIAARGAESRKDALVAIINDRREKEKPVIGVGFDAAWTSWRDANECASKFLAAEDVPGYPKMPCLAMKFALKPQLRRVENNETVIGILRGGNFAKSAGQMEHFVLEETIDMNSEFFQVLEELRRDGEDAFALEIVIDAKLLSREEITEELVSDQLHQWVAHHQGNHDKCWEQICNHKNNQSLHLHPDLRERSPAFIETLRARVVKLFKLVEGQNRVTDKVSCLNEATHKSDKHFIDKSVDFWGTYPVRMELWLVSWNDGWMRLMEFLRDLAGCPIGADSNDRANLEKWCEEKEQHREATNEVLKRKQVRRADMVAEAKGNLGGVDVRSAFIEYGRAYAQNPIEGVDAERPPWAQFEEGWNVVTNCCDCHLHVRDVDLLCRGCNARKSIAPARGDGELEKKRVFLHCLLRVFEFDQFRPIQLDTLMCPDESRVLSIPTGDGKSLVFQVELALQPSNEFTFVVVPSVALQLDLQIECSRFHLSTGAYHAQTPAKLRKRIIELISSERLQAMILAPEMLATPAIQDLVKLLLDKGVKLNLVVDEAHCAVLNPQRYKCLLPVSWSRKLFLSATLSTFAVETLETMFASTFTTFRSPTVLPSNISYYFVDQETGVNPTQCTFKLLNGMAENERRGLIYCTTVKQVETLHAELSKSFSNVSFYHAQMDRKELESRLQAFKSGEIQIMVATVAFGGGVNVFDLRFSIHHDFPTSITDFAQHSGRIARDKLPGNAVVQNYEAKASNSIENVLCRPEDYDEGVDLEQRSWVAQRRELAAMKLLLASSQCIIQGMSAHFGVSIERCGTRCSNCIGGKSWEKGINYYDQLKAMMEVVICLVEERLVERSELEALFTFLKQGGASASGGSGGSGSAGAKRAKKGVNGAGVDVVAKVVKKNDLAEILLRGGGDWVPRRDTFASWWRFSETQARIKVLLEWLMANGWITDDLMITRPNPRRGLPGGTKKKHFIVPLRGHEDLHLMEREKCDIYFEK
ncbi:ATP-dependent DNA helicase sgs1 [Podochytrium sp. JEL0797]|nr:ATP-dependent DNA helicase sgs1 [Podochytrium sp. JEL0797]